MLIITALFCLLKISKPSSKILWRERCSITLGYLKWTTFSSLQSFQIYQLSTIELLPSNRSFLEKLSIRQQLKKTLAFYGTRDFITAFTIFRHPSLSRARTIHSTPSILFLKSPFLIIPFWLRPDILRFSLVLRFSQQISDLNISTVLCYTHSTELCVRCTDLFRLFPQSSLLCSLTWLDVDSNSVFVIRS